MSLAPGQRLGPYEILSPLGTGGMGEVWKALDTKLDRHVAVKVLPAHLGAHPEALSRFEREAKALAALQHPNVMGIFDFGRDGETAYAVMELLEGQTLRAALDHGPLPSKRAVDLAREVALGLAAAHGKGIVHRDLKPENVFLLDRGPAKLLDFGLAKATASPLTGSGDAPETAGAGSFQSAPGTVAGSLMGTVGYMSPEQARGEPADARSDIFSFGCVLYEMLTGRRPFEGNHAVDVLHDILHADADLERPELSPPLRRILAHCLDKRPDQRFQSAQDLAFALETGGGSLRDAPVPARLASAPVRRGRALPVLLALLGLGAGLAAGAWWAKRAYDRPLPTFSRITFRRGNILHARFTPDGQNVVYSAAWDGRPTEVFLSRADGSGSRALGIAGATVQSVNGRGDLLVILKPGALAATTAGAGTLAQASLDGGTPRELLERVWGADYGPDGRAFAVAYQPTEGGAHRLDFPLGTRLYESPGVPLTSIHVSPKGDRVAFALNEPGAAVIAVVDLKGGARTLYRAARASEADLAWAPDGSRLFTMDGENLVSVDLAGRVRRVHADTTLAAVHHASASGRLLVEREVVRRRSVVRRDGAEADLGWQEFTRLVDLSRDGQWALLDESGGRIGPVGQPLLRRTDGSPPKLLEAGLPLALSPDARHALIRLPGKPARLRLVPTGAGSGRDLALDGWDLLEGTFSPDGLRVFAIGRKGEGPTRILDFPAAGGPGRILDSPLPRFEELTPDGRDFVALDDRRRILLAPVSGGPAREAPGSLEEGDYLVGWSDRGELRIGHAVDAAKLRVDLLDLATGARRAWTVLAPADTTGAVRIRAAKASRDGRTVAFTTGMVDVSDLLVAEGLR